MPFFSIIIPVYNVHSYLDRCLQSVLADACRDMEIILVDDGSTDDSGILCDQYAERYKNIKVVHKPNGGLSSARNAGMDLASGKWISFVDSDDWVDQNCYQKMKECISEADPSIEIVKFGYKKIVESQVIDYLPCIASGLYGLEGIRKKLIPTALGSMLISNSTINTFILSSCAHLYRRSFLTETGVRFVSEREIGSEDFLFIYSLYMKASCILVTDDEWYNYDTREGSLTRRYRDRLYSQYRKLGEAVGRQFEKNGLSEEFREEIGGFYISLMYMCIINERNYPGRKTEQVRRVGAILRNEKLAAYLQDYRTKDRKSLLIAWMMKYRTALPLCMIQWRKANNKV